MVVLSVFACMEMVLFFTSAIICVCSVSVPLIPIDVYMTSLKRFGAAGELTSAE
jgi:hypothetical protein